MAELIPAILAKSLDEFKDKIKKLGKSVKTAQIDVMDGKFVPNQTFDKIEELAEIKTDLNFQVHLMVEDVSSAISAWNKLEPANITFHLESVAPGAESGVIEMISDSQVESGVAINPETNLERLEGVAEEIDYVLVMGVKPGFSGQKMDPSIFDRIKKIKKKYSDLKVGIDGGVKLDNACKLIEAGADELIVGSEIFASSDIKSSIDKLREACED